MERKNKLDKLYYNYNLYSMYKLNEKKKIVELSNTQLYLCLVITE